MFSRKKSQIFLIEVKKETVVVTFRQKIESKVKQKENTIFNFSIIFYL